MANRSVLQDWVHNLTFMQQSVLIAAVRGPDGIRKDHVAKLLLRWLRRCFLISAFNGQVLDRPYLPGGGSFTGQSMEGPYHGDTWGQKDALGSNRPMELEQIIGRIRERWEKHWPIAMDNLVTDYLRTLDELPHHFQLHFMHAAEILGYKHPDPLVREWWHRTYLRLVNDLHLFHEIEELMDLRLGDVESQWREREEVTAKGPVA